MKLAKRLRNDEILMTAWSGIPSPELCGVLAGSGYDMVTVDMQHGAHHEGSAFTAAMQIDHAGCPAVLRIPVGRNDLASRALDVGFEAVIAPMINTVADAQAFADAMKYPPLGERSWGPGQALQLHKEHTPASYFAAANAETLAIAMIETRTALAALDDILAIEGIDGVFVGPSDLSISWSGGEGVSPDRDDMRETLVEVAAKARAAGKFAAIFAVNPARSQEFAEMGYRIMAINTDVATVKAGAKALLDMARG